MRAQRTGKVGCSIEHASGSVEAEQPHSSSRAASRQKHVHIAAFAHDAAQRQRERDVLSARYDLKLPPPSTFFDGRIVSAIYV
jgi:hypothetical protein